MATTSTISMVNKNGSIDSIYCHWDGYPSHNGMLLTKYYSDEETLKKLISLGSLSLLDSRIEPITPNHSIYTPDENVTIAYHRDRGDELNIAHFDSFSDYYNNFDQRDYNYIWVDGTWFVNTRGSKRFIPLSNALKEGV